MATVDLGKVAFVWKGTYASGTTYESKDVVQYTDSGETSSYIYVNASSASGQTPSTSGTVNTTYWAKMAGGTSLSVGNNKIITTDASGNVSSVALGTANQILQVNSGASALEFTAKPEGKVKQLIHAYHTGTTSFNSTSFVDISNISINITPTNASNKILLQGQFSFSSHDQYCYAQIVRRVSGSDSTPAGWIGDASGSRVRCQLGNMYRHSGGGDHNTHGQIPFSFCDTDHNTTNQITYQLQMRMSAGSYTGYFGRSKLDSNDVNSGRSPMFSWTAMEVA